jgi:TonB family protein
MFPTNLRLPASLALSVCLFAATHAPAQTPSTQTAQAAPADPNLPQIAVKAILTMFALNDTVNLSTTGKPLPATGSWGAQTQFPNGVPPACAAARVPCVKVVYRVPELNIVCDWTIGLLVAVEVSPTGEVQHKIHTVVLYENEAAAQYTLQKVWLPGNVAPKPVELHRAGYPEIARAARIDGAVVVRIVVGPDGLVKSAAILAGPSMLRDAVLSAVRQWKFEPLTIGSQTTSFRLDRQFNFNAAKPDFSAGMDPSGKVILSEGDPLFGPGFYSQGASSGTWESCSATGCNKASPSTPK